MMEISILEMLLKNISSFILLSSRDDLSCEPARRYYKRIEEILNLLKSSIDAIVDSNINLEDPILDEACVEVGQSVLELRELMMNWNPLMSKAYFVLQIEELISKTQTSCLYIFNLLKSSHLQASFLEISAQKVKQIEGIQTFSVITKAIGRKPTSEILAEICDDLSLNSNQEILIEAIALDKLKEQVECTDEIEFINQLILLVTQIHERFIEMKQEQSSIPSDFCCPLSLDLMIDPVIVASGQTYERSYFQRWIDLGLEVCPKTRQALSNTRLIPNYNVKALIANWCEINNVKLDQDHLKSLNSNLSGVEVQIKNHIENLQSNSIEIQREATYEIRLLAKQTDNQIIIANCGAIELLVKLLISTDLNVQEHAVTALLNLSINNENKTAIANADAIEPLIHVLDTGNHEAKGNSAATLFSLSVIDENKDRIGRSRAITSLVSLLRNGTLRGRRDAATALFNLSTFHENKGRIVKAGAVKYLMELMEPGAGMVDKAVAVLSNLSTIQEGRAAICMEGGIPYLVEVVELGSGRGKEHAAAALLCLCVNSSRFCNMVLQEGAVPPLVALSNSGTPRAKKKAQALLSYFRDQMHGGRGGLERR
ncbi:U-box domain-containing protein 2 [Impatiens glandulifera]|uniref:U-box domain-containing protein 2 n=1 Tax=Impatiens glandulifera TaxID=253017 RepID=UPI001FB06AFC|nr:U-box domain-containing protein 2 [Impatiens glandulifera]